MALKWPYESTTVDIDVGGPCAQEHILERTTVDRIAQEIERIPHTHRNVAVDHGWLGEIYLEISSVHRVVDDGYLLHLIHDHCDLLIGLADISPGLGGLGIGISGSGSVTEIAPHQWERYTHDLHSGIFQSRYDLC